jgi:hypothetical protein
MAFYEVRRKADVIPLRGRGHSAASVERRLEDMKPRCSAFSLAVRKAAQDEEGLSAPGISL